MANAYTPHTCLTEGPYRCEGIECGDNDKGERYDGVCDKDGCDINPYRMGNTDFYGRGPSYAVDTTKPMTVVTEFLTSSSAPQEIQEAGLNPTMWGGSGASKVTILYND